MANKHLARCLRSGLLQFIHRRSNHSADHQIIQQLYMQKLVTGSDVGARRISTQSPSQNSPRGLQCASAPGSSFPTPNSVFLGKERSPAAGDGVGQAIVVRGKPLIQKKCFASLQRRHPITSFKFLHCRSRSLRCISNESINGLSDAHTRWSSERRRRRSFGDDSSCKQARSSLRDSSANLKRRYAAVSLNFFILRGHFLLRSAKKSLPRRSTSLEGGSADGQVRNFAEIGRVSLLGKTKYRNSCGRGLLRRSCSTQNKKKQAPKGHVVLYVDGGSERYAVPIFCLNHPLFQDLLERTASEFGFNQQGGLVMPCCAEELEQTLCRISSIHESYELSPH
ncbi:hypothetical protein KP509_35G040700 [Ceratopteris richardii]|uniref:Small auxin up regulated protein n=1 Tax=Ceratopteris richardii TaxID=49495 RepID=A0A8T2QEQ3_CERRI|nr:hypothetical protein KP509_35G040700 [Ceratopteris richardii]